MRRAALINVDMDSAKARLKLMELLMKFEIVQGEQYAGGYNWRCRVCGSFACCEEDLYVPRDAFIPVWVKCSFGCSNVWRLEA